MNNNSYSVGDNSSSSRITKFFKDKVTGEVYRTADSINSNNVSIESHSGKFRGRILGPKLCTTCVCNKRGIVKHYSTTLPLPNLCGLLWCCLPTITKKSKISSINDDDLLLLGNKSDGNISKKNSEVISMATHCPHCDLCVVDQDHHCIYLK